MTTTKLIQDYYAAFNAGDMDAFITLLHDQVVHDINQGDREIGKDAFRRFMQHMNTCYKETLQDIVIMVDDDGNRAAAEFIVHGTYIQNDSGLPPASGQHYVLAAGAFFEIEDGKICRISNYYNLQDWIKQISV